MRALFVILFFSPFALLGQTVFQKKVSDATGFPASHRYGADFSFDNNTDTYQNQIAVEVPSFEYNIGGTLFYGVLQGTPTDAERIIPSPLSPARYVYTVKDAAAELWSDTTVRDLNQGRPFSAISYRNGDTTYSSTNLTSEIYLTGRTSQFGPDTNLSLVPTFYGHNFVGEMLGQAGNSFSQWTFANSVLTYSSSRFLNWTSGQWGASTDSGANYIDSFAVALRQAIADNGFFRNFTHAHFTGINLADYNLLLDTVRAVIDDTNAFPYIGGYTSIGEYAAMREMARAANEWKVDFRSNDIYIRCDVDTTGWPFHLVYEKVLSIPVNITGSALEGGDITCSGCAGIRKIDSANFLVDLEWTGENARAIATLTATATPDYYDFTHPTGSVSLDGTTATLTCDDCTLIVYSGSSSSYTSASSTVFRASVWGNSHSFTVTPGGHYFLGLKSREKQMNLIYYNP